MLTKLTDMLPAANRQKTRAQPSPGLTHYENTDDVSERRKSTRTMHHRDYD